MRLSDEPPGERLEMTTYKVNKLNTNTTRAQQSKLESKLKAMKGIQSVQLRPEKSEILISGANGKQPTHDAVRAAVEEAGFSLRAQI
jgi:hypothetical protein